MSPARAVCSDTARLAARSRHGNQRLETIENLASEPGFIRHRTLLRCQPSAAVCWKIAASMSFTRIVTTLKVQTASNGGVKTVSTTCRLLGSTAFVVGAMFLANLSQAQTPA